MVKVVILEDEPWSRKVVHSLIEWERLGLELAGEAEDGQSGLELIGRVHPDIVITDMRMPGMEGTELLEKLRSEFPQIRILVMSGYDDYPLIRQALKSNVMDYLLKLLDPAELNRILETCLEDADTREDLRPVSLKTTVIFDKVELLEEYLVIRRLVFGHLLELDIKSVDQSLDALADFLRKSTTAVSGSHAIRHIAADYTRMLVEFLSLNSRG
ncbi:MAG: response regulator [Spirochaetaceae bacterium]|nr:response regulator [Spirochaetaceae bacterium]